MAKATPTTLTDPWSLARNRYMEDLSDDEKKLFATASLENLFYSTSVAQKEHEAHSKSRAISARLEPFISAIDQYATALDVSSNTYSLAMSPIWGSIRVLLHFAKAFEKYFEKLIDMLTRIGDILPRCSVYQSLFPTHERLLQAISKAYLDIIHFCMDAKETFRKLKKSTTLIQRDFLLSQISTTTYINKHLIQRKIRHSGTGVWITQTVEFKNWIMGDTSSCLWLYGIPGSGKTVLASRLIDAAAEKFGVVDVTIQSLTSRHIIDQQLVSQETGLAFHYCDFSDPRSLDTSNILGGVIRQLLDKIVIPEVLERQINSYYRVGTRTPSDDELVDMFPPLFKQFSKIVLLIDGLDECTKEVQTTILSIVNLISKYDFASVKIIIASREEATISTLLKEHPRLQISTENLFHDIATFVEETVNNKIESGALVLQDTSLKFDIMHALTAGAQGMFLWVKFQIIELCDAASDFAITEVLQNLPEGMAATYARILRKIARSRTDATLARGIFKWIVCAKRPLLLTELAEAIAFGPADKSWDSRKIPNVSRLVQACGNLVVFQENDKPARLAHHTVQQFLLQPPAKDSISEFHFQLSQADIEAGEVCVAYLSFSDFERQVTRLQPESTLLVSDMPCPAAIMGRTTSTLGLGSVTMGMMKFGKYIRTGSTPYRRINFDLGKFAPPKKMPPSSLTEKYLLLDYAIQNWIHHTSNFLENNIMWPEFKRLALDKRLPFEIRTWPDRDTSNDLPHRSLFHWAVEFGHVPLLRLLSYYTDFLDLPERFLQKASQDESLLVQAVRSGHTNLIEYLAHEFGINDQVLSVLLFEATEIGNDLLVQVLLQFGADVNARSVRTFTDIKFQRLCGFTALHLAARFGHEALVRLLIEKGSDIGARSSEIGRYGYTALHLAAEFGQVTVVRLLIDKGSDIAAILTGGMGSGYTSLHLAALGGHAAVVRLLIEKGSDIAAISGAYGYTALHLAAQYGQAAVVSLLIEKGSDIAAISGAYGYTALHLAALDGHAAVVRLLIEKGSDIAATAENHGGYTALHLAARSGREAVVRLLIKEGSGRVVLSSTDEATRTLLREAVLHGWDAIVELLVENIPDLVGKDVERWKAEVMLQNDQTRVGIQNWDDRRLRLIRRRS